MIEIKVVRPTPIALRDVMNTAGRTTLTLLYLTQQVLAADPVDTTPPTITSINPTGNYNEGVAISGTMVANESVTWSKSGADAARVILNALTGVWSLEATNYEAKANYSWTFTATDAAGNTTSQNIAIAINDVDENAPTITSANPSGNYDEGVAVGGTLTSSEAVTWSATGADAARVTLNANTGAWSLEATDYETKSSYSWTFVATDGAGLTASQVVAISINDLDENAPAITSANPSGNYDEGVALSGTLTSNETVTWSKVGTDAASVTLNATTGEWTLEATDYETKSSYSWTFVATDGSGLTSSQVIAISLNDIDEVAPTITSANPSGSYNEGVAVSGTLTADEPVTWSKSGADAALVTLNTATGEWSLEATDYETRTSYAWMFTATDSVGLTSNQNISIAINNVAEGGGSAFTYQRMVTVNNTGNTAKADYPVEVKLTSANFDFTRTQSDGRDIQFKDGATILSHWIEAWDSTGQTATIWVKMPNIAAGASPAITMLYGSASAVNTSDIYNTFIFGEDFSDQSRLLGYPNKEYPATAARAGVYGMVFGNWVQNVITGSGVVGAWDEIVREPGNVVYDPTDPDPAKRYKIYYTGQTLPVTTGARRIGLMYAASYDGPWTAYTGNPVIGNGTADRAEDPYIVRNIDGSAYRDGSGKLHLFSEDQGNQDILHYTSSDGIAWTADPSNPVVERGATGAYDDVICASPVVIHCGGDNKFVMLYEGRSSVSDGDPIGYGDEYTMLARATSLMGKVWTKEPTNPITNGDVPDDVCWTGSEWIYIYHRYTTTSYTDVSTVADPWLWDDTSFTPTPNNPQWSGPVGGSQMFGPGPGGHGSRVLSPNTSTAMDMFDVLGSDIWAFERIGAGTAPIGSEINTTDGVLEFVPINSSSAHTIVAYTKQLALTSNFKIMARRKVSAAPNDRFAQIGFGSGLPGFENANFPHHADGGYYFVQADPGVTGNTGAQIRKYVGTTATAIANGLVTTAEASNFNRHEMSYLSDGSLRWSINGSVKVSATDTANLAMTKNIAINQVSTSGSPGGVNQLDWIVVAKYDGQDPATTVGSESAA